ncbi:MAG: extracellular solute-binding protein, partial [bacterium]
APWIWGAGGDFISPDEKEARFNTEESLNGIEYFMNLIANGYISKEALALTTEEVARAFFFKGEFSMSIPGPLSLSSPFDPANPLYLEEIATNCASSLFPEGPKGRFIFCGGSNLAVTSFSKNPEQAWEFVKHLTSYESQSRYPRALNMFPAILEYFDALFIAEERAEWKGLKNAWKYGRSFPNVAAWGAIEVLLIECFGKNFARMREGIYNFSLVKDDLDTVAYDIEELLGR